MGIDASRIRELAVSHESFFEQLPDIAPPLCPGAANSVSSGADDGTINKLAGLFWNPLRHLSIQEVRTNLSLPRRDLFPEPAPGQKEMREQNIAGHGNTGFIEVGDGQIGDGIEYVGHWNQDHWGWPLALAGQDWDGMLTFWSCGTGGGRGGAKLLFNVARTTNRLVRARTGDLLVVTQGNRRWVEFERNSSWQQARPDMTQPPPPIDPPSIPADKRMPEQAGGIIAAEHVRQVRIERLVEGEWRHGTVTGNDVDRLTAALFHSLPFGRVGSPLAIVTGRMLFDMDDGTTIAIQVQAERIVDFAAADVRFYASPQLGGLLDELIG